MNTMPNLDELLDAMLSPHAEDTKFVQDSANKVSSDTVLYDYFDERYDGSLANCHPQRNGFDEADDPSALNTIEFTNSNARAWTGQRVHNFIQLERENSSDCDPVDDSLTCLDVIPPVDYDDCFDKFLDSVKRTDDIASKPIEMGPLKNRSYAEQRLQPCQIAVKQPLPDLHVSANMSKSQTSKATKTILYETKKTIMEMDKMEMHLNESFTKASQQAAADFKAIRDAVLNREAQVLAGLRRAKDSAARTIRRQKMSGQSIQKACEQKFDGEPKRFRQLVDSFEHFYTASGDVLSWTRQTPYKFRELKDILEAIEDAGVFIAADPKAN